MQLPSAGQAPEGVREEEVEQEGLRLGHEDMALDELQPEEGAETGLDDGQTRPRPDLSSEDQGFDVGSEESLGDEDEKGIVEQGQVRPRDLHDEDSGGSSQQPAHKMLRQQPDDASSEDNESLRAMREVLMNVEVREFIGELERVKTFKTSNHRRRRTMAQ